MNTSSSENVNLQGLGDAQVEASRSQHGENVLTPPRRTSYWKLYLDKYHDPIIQILLVAALVSLLLAFIERDFMETLGIILAVVIATTVGFYFECDAARRFNVLTAMNEDQRVKVRRNGRVTEVKRREVVVGDIILVEVGDEIPADAQLVEAVNLQVDESSLTGEPLTTKSIDATKEGNEAYPPNVILRSTMVMNGRGTAVVTAVGDATEIGKVAQKSTESTLVKTPLNIQLDKLAKLISKIGTIVSVAAFVIFLVHDILTNSIWHGNDYFGMMHIVLNYFMMAVTLIVMAVPEGLPMAVTLALALNMRRMLKSNVLVRKLHASETMGAVTVICTDKTGTLTQNKMRVDHITPANPSDPNSELLLNVAMAVNSTAELDGENVVGNPTEGALLLWLRDHDKHYATLRQQYKVVSQQPFSTEKKYMLTTVDMGDKTMTFVKGAPEIVLNMCTPDAPERQRAEEVLAHYQQQAMRTLAFAYATGDEPFTLQGVVAISDPVRPDVPPAVAECQRAGIQVKVVTGDTSATAIEIARQIGVWPAHGEREEATWHITGTEWASLSDEEAFKRCMALRVMSRARPTDKQRLVEMLQRHGEVVAVTGDGTNDAPALNHAHVGLSLGSGTSVAKQASDITLLDDSFHAIANAVMWGRSLYKNIQRFLYFQLVVNLSALLLVLGGSIIGTEMPLTVTQILWVNLIMDTFAAMALASLPPSHEVMRNKPRRDTDFIISRPMARGILFCGMVFFLGMFMFLIWCERHGAGSVVDVHELTLFFTTFVMLQFWNLFNAKSLGSDYSAFRYFWRDGGLVLVLALVFIGQWIIVTFGGKMFRTLPLSFEEWGAITVGTSVVLWAGELWRAWKRWCNRKFSVLKP
ncbi:calcium-translocating P-type ATPase, PMCA-type [Hallella sp.]|uniref:calcium-translocating P-type ATPase, PMCA-type n=1 Tax=Hallella sp. TaxID=2980186 RepID=UPI00258EFFA1|nr:calcium-translocating P-type ATPase, PMCA-type [Hallella sp.]MDD7146695.1 calcium-translocating P-type ATPase, PMCA-type [Hallella sp.]MDY5925920.1 calcium-translocating P-type ATPase, PMCA-type [Hallella sp.]